MTRPAQPAPTMMKSMNEIVQSLQIVEKADRHLMTLLMAVQSMMTRLFEGRG
jgi:hypothetical protein